MKGEKMSKRTNQKIRLTVFAMIVCVAGTIAAGETIFVDVDATGNNDGSSWTDAFNNIQDGLDAAGYGDEIWVAEGTYYERINFNGVSCTLTSTYPNDPNVVASTIIDGNNINGEDVVTLENSEDANTVITGFTITNGGLGADGIWCNGASPTISNCTVSSNARSGIYCIYGSPAIINCTTNSNGGAGIACTTDGLIISDCTANYNGHDGGEVSAPHATITGCIFNGNDARGLILRSTLEASSITVQNCIMSNTTSSLGVNGSGIKIEHSNTSAAIMNCIIYDNYGRGINSTHYDTTNVTNCTVVGNGGYGIHKANEITNCIVWDNSDDLRYCSATYSCIEDGDAGTGNIHSDPLFYDDPCDPNNYHLSSNSPCIDEGDPNGDYGDQTDIDGEDRVINGRVDMGADEYYWSPADYDKNETVNFVDYAIFANAWQTVDANISLDDNNDVDYYDLALFCEDWLWQASWTKTFRCGAGRGFGLKERPYSTIVAKQQSVDIEPVDVERLLKWLEYLWLTNEDLREDIADDEWLEFIKAVKLGAE
jgi:hypothetical protein